MLLTKEVEITINPKTFKYYKELGYKFKHVGDKVVVKIEHLLKGSNVIVQVACDYCGKEIYNVKYNTYNRVIKNTGSYVCENCASLKRKNTTLERYGVENICYLESVKQKKIETNIKKYGVSNPTKSKEIQEKTKQTNLYKYGVENPMQNKKVKEKMKKTNLQKYGCEYVVNSNDIKEKINKTIKEKYGVNNIIDIPGVKEKMVETLYKNNSQKTSLQQLYLHTLYGGEINYPIKYYNVDICLTNEQIIIEYDGGGHMLNVTTGRETINEYNRKTLIRDKTVKQEGYKQIRIISSKDYLPSDEILLQMLEQAKEYFNNTTHTWVEYNIDTSLMRNAENKEGVFFDYGNLRKIKKAS